MKKADRILVDAGTAYTKVLQRGRLRIFRTERAPRGFKAFASTGHNAHRFGANLVNELVALARGGADLAREKDLNLVDIGCRDIKFVRIRDGKYAGCGWNDSCGAMTGFALELLADYFDLDYSKIAPSPEAIGFTCGILGIAGMFDQISLGKPVDRCVAGLVRGLADRVFEFAEKPARLFVSGGLCENRLFLQSFDCEIIPLGRAVLLRGLSLICEGK